MLDGQTTRAGVCLSCASRRGRKTPSEHPRNTMHSECSIDDIVCVPVIYGLHSRSASLKANGALVHRLTRPLVPNLKSNSVLAHVNCGVRSAIGAVRVCPVTAEGGDRCANFNRRTSADFHSLFPFGCQRSSTGLLHERHALSAADDRVLVSFRRTCDISHISSGPPWPGNL